MRTPQVLLAREEEHEQRAQAMRAEIRQQRAALASGQRRRCHRRERECLSVTGLR